jgi:hypothetical protein
LVPELRSEEEGGNAHVMEAITDRVVHSSPPPPIHVAITITKGPPCYGAGVIIERVVKETTASVQYPSLLMRVNLQAQGLHHAVEPEEDVVEYPDDRFAFTAILWAVLPEMLASLTTKRTAQFA